MSIQSEITRISGNVSDAFDAITAKGVTVPSGSTSDNLATLIAQIQTTNLDDYALKSMLSGVESTTTSTHAYSVGDLLIYDDTLYKVIVAIAIGDTLTENTNIVATTIEEQLQLTTSTKTSLSGVIIGYNGTLDTGAVDSTPDLTHTGNLITSAGAASLNKLITPSDLSMSVNSQSDLDDFLDAVYTSMPATAYATGVKFYSITAFGCFSGGSAEYQGWLYRSGSGTSLASVLFLPDGDVPMVLGIKENIWTYHRVFTDQCFNLGSFSTLEALSTLLDNNLSLMSTYSSLPIKCSATATVYPFTSGYSYQGTLYKSATNTYASVILMSMGVAKPIIGQRNSLGWIFDRIVRGTESTLYYTSQAVSAQTSGGQIMRIPASSTDDDITTDTVVLECTFADPSKVTSSVSWQSYAGYITFTGTTTGSTTANVTLGRKMK